MDINLRAFINRLESLPDNPSHDGLKKCLREMDGRQVSIDEYVNFSEQGYKRNVVHVSSRCEISVLCFQTGQHTPIHDHGDSIGVTIIRQGTMTEELFDRQPTGMIVSTFTRRFQTEEFSCVNLTTIHRVSNAHSEGLVMINIYFPPLTVMNFYNLENASVEKWVADYSGVKGT
ncbi:MAG: cysteine dioxygenase family protein [Candidatus Brocadia sp.]|uniref:Cysteine dioxygenase n=1 Tax=Candidatus Brocadia fulgida TaxID=380242 RepID=A0A0M2V045_9BACT|nr:MAG: hypothetical protein BROFUL_00025 [Candidatus Brocadia fulgida]UJS22418.1 MAG: cysteine dioxygenase family protein [Candidatus Brocadia sp.]